MSIYTSSDIFRNKYITVYQDATNTDVLYYTHNNGSKEILVLVNVRNGEKTFSVPESFEGNTYTNLMDNSDITLTGSMQMSAYQYYILEKK